MGPNGKIYLSMGVGVVTPERTEPIEVVIPADPIEVPEQGPEEMPIKPTESLEQKTGAMRNSTYFRGYLRQRSYTRI
jgi:hypothetical protein